METQPKIVLLFFLLLIFVELYWIRIKLNLPYPWKDSLASLGVAIGQHTITLLYSGTLMATLLAVWKYRLFDIPIETYGAKALLFLSVEFVYYWFHRVSHTFRWFWGTHSVHHTTEHLNLSSAYRLGWTGPITGVWLFWTPLVLIGFHPKFVLGMLGINLAYQFWLHTTLIPKLGKFEYFFNTPSHHRVHHAKNDEYINRNFGGILIVFDRIFGTFAEEKKDIPCEYGLKIPRTSLNPIQLALGEWLDWGTEIYRKLRYRLPPDGTKHTTTLTRP